MTSIECKLAGVFSSPQLSQRKSVRGAPRESLVTASVTLFIPELNLLFVGLTDGDILYWETDQYIVEKRMKDKKPGCLTDHKGNVRSMIFVASLCSGVMFTGSADRCIKMWDLSDPTTTIPCVQTFHGHGGTVLALDYGANMLFSSSTDGLLYVWRDSGVAKLLRFPTYNIRQKITASGSPSSIAEAWFLSIFIRESEMPLVFAGDSDGYLHIYKADVSHKGDREYSFSLQCKAKVHGLGISKLIGVPTECFLFSLSYDQTFKKVDSLNGRIICEEGNQSNVTFNGIAWDPDRQDAIIADDRGTIGFYNLYTESWVARKSVTKDPIMQVQYESSVRRLLVLSPSKLQVFEICRGVKILELCDHTGPIVALASKQSPQGGLLYTAAMDNTIRMWDADTLECIQCLHEHHHEITAMVYLPKANVIATGHENADLKIWSLDSQDGVCLRKFSGQSVHGNTISALACAVSDGRKSRDSLETLIAGSYDRQISFWRVMLTIDGTAVANFEHAFLAHEESDDEVLAVVYSHETKFLFTSGNHGHIRKWGDSGMHTLQAEYRGHDGAVVCFAVNANYLYSGSADCTVRVWDVFRDCELRSVKVHIATVQAIIVLPENNTVLSCAFDGRVVLWDPLPAGESGVHELHTYEQPDELRALTFVSGTNTVLVGCESGKIFALPMPQFPQSPSVGHIA